MLFTGYRVNCFRKWETWAVKEKENTHRGSHLAIFFITFFHDMYFGDQSFRF